MRFFGQILGQASRKNFPGHAWGGRKKNTEVLNLFFLHEHQKEKQNSDFKKKKKQNLIFFVDETSVVYFLEVKFARVHLP